MRITENMKFSSSVNSLFDVEEQYNTLLEKLSTQKEINRPSDDPVGVTRLINIKQQQTAIAQYKTNASSAESWVSLTESKLNSANDLIVNAKQLATTQSSATATVTTRLTTASNVQGLIDQMQSLANSQMNGRYIFSGTSTKEPFSATASAATVGTAVAAGNNVFDGTATSSGTYTGDRNKSYALKVTSGGPLATAKYVVSIDGGKTWGSEQTGLDVPVTVGDGITLSFAAGTKDMTANDLFTADGTTAGYYAGNGTSLSMRIGQNMTIGYSITGEQAFTDKGAGGVDVLKTLNDLKTALQNNDPAGIRQQLDNLDLAQRSISMSISQCGTQTNQIDITQSNIDDIKENLGTMQTTTEAADITELATKFAMKQVALQASYSMASKIGQTSILDYLK